jgi:DNA-binding transcriptional MocR family regulator
MGGLSKNAILIKQIFEFFRRLGKPIFPSLKWLAGQIKTSTRTVQRALKELREAGVLVTRRRYRRSSLQELRDERQMAFDFAAEKEPEAPARKPAVASHGATVVNPSSKRIQRRDDSSPLVLFVYKWVKATLPQKAKNTPEPAEDLEALNRELTARAAPQTLRDLALYPRLSVERRVELLRQYERRLGVCA